MPVPLSVRKRRKDGPQAKPIDRPFLPSFAAGKRGMRIMTCTVLLIVMLGILQSHYILSNLYFPSTSFFFHRLGIGGTGMCSKIPYNNIERQWTSQFTSILQASKHPDDPDFSHEEWTQFLLKGLPSSVLRKAIRSYPPPEATSKVLKILSDKISSPETAPPLKIAVVGGSTAEGKGCEVASSVGIPTGSIMGNPLYCAWPYRFEHFINSILNLQAIQVINMAEEGTETALITPLLRNRIYPPPLLPHGPDVIINAYGTADYELSLSQSDNPALTIRNEMNDFVSAAEEASRSCASNVGGGMKDPPLIINMEDSSVGGVIGEGKIMSINYNDAISKINTIDNIKSRLNDVPFGMAGHVALVWVLAFSIADGLIRYCQQGGGSSSKTANDMSQKNAIILQNQTECNENNDPCVFAWFAGPTGTVQKAIQILQYVDPFIKENNGWEATSDMSTGWSRKAGLEATIPNASITFEMKNIKKEVRFINVMTLRSHLAKWQGGKAKFTIWVDEKKKGKDVREVSFEIEGSHDLPRHITYPLEVDLKNYKARVGSDVRLKVELVDGNSFKILGILVCS